MLEVIHQISLVGKKHENQDAFLVKDFDNGDKLLAVADGMGGGVLGAELSLLAVSMIDKFFLEPLAYPQEKLKRLLLSINSTMLEMLSVYSIESREVENIQKGGTTLCMAYYREGRVHYVNIGDSRVWVCRNGEILNLTLDQNEYERKHLENIYTDDEDKRFIFKILGKESSLEIDNILKSDKWSASGSFELNVDDLLFLSSDGFHDYIDKECFCHDIFYDFDKTLKEIEERSNDNITMIMAKEER